MGDCVEWLSAPEDEEGMAKRITKLLEDGQARERWSKRLQKNFMERFTIQESANKIVEVYRGLLRHREVAPKVPPSPDRSERSL